MMFIEYNEPLGYLDGLNLQKEYHQKVANEGHDPVVLLLEHAPTVTFGKHSSPSHLLVDKTELEAKGVSFVKTERGGQVTGHEPGQLVIYPILPIAAMGLTVRKYVCLFEQSIIDTVKTFGVESSRDQDHPGVWVGKNKICAIGIRVGQRVSMHGAALNVNNELDVFNYMTPCGIEDRGVSSLSREVGKDVPVEKVRSVFRMCFQNAFG